MSELFGIPPDTSAEILWFGLLYMLTCLSPVLCATVLAVRSGTLQRRALYVSTVTALSYGTLMFLYFTLSVPTGLLMTYAVPWLEHLGYLQGNALLHAARFYQAWSWALVPPIFAIASLIVARYLARRWNRVTEAIRV